MRQNDLKYVPQFDDLNEKFTIRELLTYTGQLQTPEKTPLEMRKHVSKLITILGLTEKVC